MVVSRYSSARPAPRCQPTMAWSVEMTSGIDGACFEQAGKERRAVDAVGQPLGRALAAGGAAGRDAAASGLKLVVLST